MFFEISMDQTMTITFFYVLDRQVGELYEEGSRKARSSDSSRRTRLSHRNKRSWVTAANTSFASNIQKMFSEKIEVFSPVDASKVNMVLEFHTLS